MIHLQDLGYHMACYLVPHRFLSNSSLSCTSHLVQMCNSFLYVVACGMATAFTGWELPDPVSSIHHVLYSHT
jgi:hypothetical protein